ncbi:hypothetical protein [Dactylosporangium sp. CA-139066]|uniref:hypothetical protein n=1 Tax=Dactylosporangium sp. CA-139066 TaxID=3239930 RepID=UPI003D920059
MGIDLLGSGPDRPGRLVNKPVVDLVGLPIGTVDGVETAPGRDGAPEIVALLVEPKRWFGRGHKEQLRISWDLVAFCDRTITLMVRKYRVCPS